MPDDIRSLLDRVASEAPEPLRFVRPMFDPPRRRRPRSSEEPSIRTRTGVVLLALTVAAAGTFFAIRAFGGVGKDEPVAPAPLPQRVPTSFTPGRIAYETLDGLFTMNPNGSDVRQVDSSPNANQPAWSPDGQLLAYAENNPGPGASIYVMNANGSGVRMLTTPDTVGYEGIEGNPGGSQDYFPLWSPDGTQVAFLRAAAGALQIGLINADGSGQRILTSNNSELLAWTPQGLLEIGDPVQGLVLLDPVTLKTSDFTIAGEMGCRTDPHADGVTFSLDGSVAVCWSDEPKTGRWTLAVMDLPGHALRTYRLDVGKAGFTDAVWRPAIAPDGSAVVFESFHGQDDLLRLDLAGASRGQVTAVTDTSQNEGWPVWTVASP